CEGGAAGGAGLPRDGLRGGALAGGAPRSRRRSRARQAAQHRVGAGRRRLRRDPARPSRLTEELRMPYQTLSLTRADGVATLTLSRPDAFNALDMTLGRELFHAVLEADEDAAVRAVVVTGAGKAFCAGGDVKAFVDNLGRIGAHVKELTTYLHGAISRFCRSDKPVVMAVNGVAAGGGFSLGVSGGLRVAAEAAEVTAASPPLAAPP